jgi:hypothetical protein
MSVMIVDDSRVSAKERDMESARNLATSEARTAKDWWYEGGGMPGSWPSQGGD